MTHIAFFLCSVLIGLAIAQGVLAIGFARSLRTPTVPLLPDTACPKAAVILCLRGTDPFLKNCLEALFRMDYPNYEIHIVIDHPSDPAWITVRETLRTLRAPHVHLHTLQTPRETCSLKCSSILHVTSTLDDSYGFIAQLDADAIPHTGWLRELATALADESVGAATGNRWYMPQDAAWGSLVRYFWNAAAVVPMYWFKIAWGGTLAVKMQVLRESNVLDRWGHAFCEDTMLYGMLKPHGLSVAFVPSLLMVNRESCTLKGFYHWVQRQFLTVRLYHPRWDVVVAHGISTTIANALALGFLVAAAIQQHMTALAILAAGLAIFHIGNTLWLILLERAARHPIGQRGESVAWLSLSKLIKMSAAVFLTQVIYFAALWGSLLLRKVDWRGVSYRIDGPWAIRLMEYRPYQPESSVSETTSL